MHNTSEQERPDRPLTASFERYLQDKGKGPGGSGGNYRRIATREIERFAEWAAGDRGPEDWTGVTPEAPPEIQPLQTSPTGRSGNMLAISLVTVG
jgi:hypothetical protein